MLTLCKENIRSAVNALEQGGLVVFPTETVYGLGGNAYNDKVVASIYQYKERPKTKALSVCYPDLPMANSDVEIGDAALLLAKKFMPGPINLGSSCCPEPGR